MDDTQYLLDVYRGIPVMLQGHLSDLSDADMLVRPSPSANHAAWQVAHLVNSTTNIVNLITPGAMPALPEEFTRIAGKDGSKLDSGFETKEQLLARFAKVVDAAVAWVQSLGEADKAKPTPERLRGLAKTVGEMTVVLPVHIAMHVGQIQGIRRKLGKPVLF